MTDTEIREFEFDRDLSAVKRIWQEVGWTEGEDDLKQLDLFFADGHTLVATVDGTPECSVHTLPGNICIAQTQLPMLAVTAVTTSHLGRGRSFAQKLTAMQLIRAQKEGAAIAALGMFDQGFYDKVGFATGAYERELTFDPGILDVDLPRGEAVRLTADDAEEMHDVLANRHRSHGSAVLDSVTVFKAELGFGENGFGLGYRDTDGALTHFMWLDPDDNAAHGPYRVKFMGYKKPEQILELLGLLKSLSDQIYSVSIIEPPELQLQALLKRPFRSRDLSKGSKHQSEFRALAWWQTRILDLPACVRALSDATLDLEFEAQVSDPLAGYENDAGIEGRWRIKLGADAGAEPVSASSDLAVLETSVNSLTRLLTGVGSASSLALTDNIVAPRELLMDLDRSINLPSPMMGWDF